MLEKDFKSVFQIMDILNIYKFFQSNSVDQKIRSFKHLEAVQQERFVRNNPRNQLRNSIILLVSVIKVEKDQQENIIHFKNNDTDVTVCNRL